MFPLDHYYQDTHLNLFPKKIVHAENLAGDISQGGERTLLHRLLPAEGHGSRIDVGPVRCVARRRINETRSL